MTGLPIERDINVERLSRLLEPGRPTVVCGAQAGSEAKGKFSAALAYAVPPDEPLVICMASSPNAGHTVVTDDGRKFVTYHLPAAMIGATLRRQEYAQPGVIIEPHTGVTVLLGPASVIEPGLFMQEIRGLIDSGILGDGVSPSIIIDPRASIITQSAIEYELQGSSTSPRLTDIGSTASGSGITRATKLMRGAMANVNFVSTSGGYLSPHFNNDDKVLMEEFGVTIGDTTTALRELLLSVSPWSSNKSRGDELEPVPPIIVEMTQGFDLCLEHGIDPKYCTSKMITPAMALAEAGIPVSSNFPSPIVVGVLRPYPIRVNNRTGTSGPYADAEELTWGEVSRCANLPDDHPGISEITTTTKLPRRVFTFSEERYRRFLDVVRPDYLAIQFANYLDWNGAYGVRNVRCLPDRVMEFAYGLWGSAADHLNVSRVAGALQVVYIGTGPAMSDYAMYTPTKVQRQQQAVPQADRSADHE